MDYSKYDPTVNIGGYKEFDGFTPDRWRDTNTVKTNSTAKKSSTASKKAASKASPKYVAPKIDYTAIINMLNEQMQQRAKEEKLAHSNRLATLEGLYNSAKVQRDKEYSDSTNSQKQDNAERLRKLYIGSMLTKRNNLQGLAAQGFSGGLPQSEEMRVQRGYENAREAAQKESESIINRLAQEYARQDLKAKSTFETEKSTLLSALSKSLAALQDQLQKSLAKYK